MADLPKLWKGGYTDVATLTDDARREAKLSSRKTIVEVWSDGTAGGDAEAITRVGKIVAYIRTQGVTALDAETGPKPEFEHEEKAALDPHKSRLVLVQLGDETWQFLLWWETLPPEAQQMVRDLIEDPDVRKLGVNLKFDLKRFFVEFGVDAFDPKGIIDAQNAEQVLCCGLTGDIGFTMKLTGMGPMAKRWLGLLLVKDEDIRTGWHKMTPGVWWPARDECASDEEYVRRRAEGMAKKYYAADDVVVPIKLLQRQTPWIRHFDLIPTFKLEMEFLPRLAEMEVRGLLLHQEQWKALSDEVAEKYKEAVRALDKLFDVTVTYRVAFDGTVEVTRDKNYGSKDELRDLIHDWMREHRGVEVICNNKQFKEALLRHGANPMRLEKLFEKKLVDDPDNPGKRKQVAYPGMADLIDGSPFVEEPLWDRMSPRLPEGTFKMTSTESKGLRLLRILHETPNDKIDDLPEIPTKIGLPPELVDPILAFREFGTKLSRYAYSWLDMVHPVTNRIHSEFTQTCADTGRLTSRPNFQNLPGKQAYRTAVCQARPGHKVVGADLSQIEPRLIAEISHCAMYMRVFWSGFPGTDGFNYWCGEDVVEELDLYGTVGAELGVLPPEGARKSIAKLPENKGGRQKAKTVVLGLGYGTGKPKYHISFCLDTKEYHERAEADALYDGFWNAAHEVKETLDALSDIADHKKSKRKVYHPYADAKCTYAETIGGRKRFFAPGAKGVWTQSRNMPIQGAGADVLKLAVCLLYRACKEKGIKGWLLLTAHDELIGEAPDEHAEAYAREMEKAMSAAGAYYCQTVPVTAEAYTADHWVKD